MISLVKIVTEGYAFDADDYVPYSNLKVGDIVRCINSDETLKVLEIPGDNKLIVSLTDDPRDIRAVIFGEDVTAHASDQEDLDLDEADNHADISPESIIYDDETIISTGKGFDSDDIAQALEQAFASSRPSALRLKIVNRPAEIGDRYFVHIHSFEDVSNDLEQLLKDDCRPSELEQHIIGWIVAANPHHEISVYPYLDSEGVKIFKDSKEYIDNDVRSFYANSRSNYRGD